MMQSKVHLALGASLVLNTLLIGFLVGKVTSQHRPRWAPPPIFHDVFRPHHPSSAMPDQLKRALIDSEFDLVGLRDQVRESRLALGTALGEEEINQDKVNQALADHIEYTHRFTAASQEALVKSMAQLPAKERKKLLKRLARGKLGPKRPEATD